MWIENFEKLILIQDQVYLLTHTKAACIEPYTSRKSIKKRNWKKIERILSAIYLSLVRIDPCHPIDKGMCLFYGHRSYVIEAKLLLSHRWSSVGPYPQYQPLKEFVFAAKTRTRVYVADTSDRFNSPIILGMSVWQPCGRFKKFW